jgi:uncharacterized repeat protein (TIGR03803 family)
MRNTIRPLVSGRYLHVASVVLTLAVLMMPALLATRAVQAQTYSVLYTFTGGEDGANPSASLIRDKKGFLYGTTLSGGAFGNGTVFRISSKGKETVLHSFKGAPDGANPVAELLLDSAGVLFGTTANGGTGGCVNGNTTGCGAIFQLSPKAGGEWKETVLYSFMNLPTDGQYPQAGLISAKSGILYGTTAGGGNAACGCGTVFELRPDSGGGWTETILYSFMGNSMGDGEFPYETLVMDPSGNLYGATIFGGGLLGDPGAGTVFKLDNMGQETVLFRFPDGGKGENPHSRLLWYAGKLYGTTTFGNHHTQGTTFKLDKVGRMTVLYRFTGNSDGGNPEAGLVQDKAGNSYGTTFFGGDLNCVDAGGVGCGVIFKLNAAGQEVVLHSFAESDGANPSAALVRDAVGNLYGTTMLGGNPNCDFFGKGCGVVFLITPN